MNIKSSQTLVSEALNEIKTISIDSIKKILTSYNDEKAKDLLKEANTVILTPAPPPELT